MSSLKESFLDHVRVAREERQQARVQELAAVRIQVWTRGCLCRRRLRHQANVDVDGLFADELTSSRLEAISAREAFGCIRRVVFVNDNIDTQRLTLICRYVARSVSVCSSVGHSYGGVSLVPTLSRAWISVTCKLLHTCCTRLSTLHVDRASDCSAISVLLNCLLTMTAADAWRLVSDDSQRHLAVVVGKLCGTLLRHVVDACGLMRSLQELFVRGLCGGRVCLTAAQLGAATTLSTRPILARGDDVTPAPTSHDDVISSFMLHILSVPALVWRLAAAGEQFVSRMQSARMLRICVRHLLTERHMNHVFDQLTASSMLVLVANLLNMAHLNSDAELADILLPDLTAVLTRLLQLICGSVSACRQSSLSCWHPLLGWLSQQQQSSQADQTLDCVADIKRQLQILWSRRFTAVLFASSSVPMIAPTMITPTASSAVSWRAVDPGRLVKFFRRALDKRGGGGGATLAAHDSKCVRVAVVCKLYQMALQAFTQMRSDILTVLCHSGTLLLDLWSLMRDLGADCGLRQFLSLLASEEAGRAAAVEFHVLCMFCDCMFNYLVVLDDVEMYEEQKLFKLSDYVQISSFLNTFVYKIIVNNLIDVEQLSTSALFLSVHALLILLYRRDCRRRFTTDSSHWTVPAIKNAVLNDIEKGRQPAVVLLQKVPHMIAREERVYLFRQEVAREKTALGLNESAFSVPRSTLITVHRSCLLEDGYRQLAALSTNLLKGCIRVKFVNRQGLDEAGIDQDGVFKEFLEECVRCVFDPALSLFNSTADHRLYPSANSHVHNDHLQLLEFVGKLLGKAVYEGIVVDVPFAQFFLSELLGHSHQRLYCSIDELPSLDPQLYQNISYIKRYEGDVHELGLTFSYDEDVMGQLVTHDLIPGGRVIPVTSENRISYVYHLAHFRMQVQIRPQLTAFTRGFRSLIRAEWLAMFSPSELQRLISGDSAPLDVRELRRYTQYYGGYHDKHRVIGWFWHVLDKDFSEQEKKMFLKFVTSCSNAPLMGFAHLEPPFSIRCVNVADEEDTGDTLGSMLRGFFSVRRREPVTRLPTSSTCFNLLKLPNYHKKATLRDKLRYSIANNTGFELS